MAEPADFEATTSPTLQQLVDYFINTLFALENIDKVQALLQNAHAKGATLARGAEVQASAGLSEKKSSLLDMTEDAVSALMSRFCSLLVAHMLGVELPAINKSAGAGSVANSSVGNAVADVLLKGIRGDAQSIEPGEDGSRRLMSMIGHLSLTGWFEGVVFEEMAGLGGIVHAPEALAELGHELVDAMGLSRLMRRALQPYISVLMQTPLQWSLNKTYRPNMLGDADVVKAFLRGDYTAEEAREELARAGYSERRMDMLIANQLKQLSLDDALVLVREGQIDRTFVLATLRASGYDAPGAEMALNAAEVKYLAAIHDDSFAAVRAAYVDRRIDDGAFEQFLEAIYPDDATRSAHEVAARTMRDVNTKFLTSTEAEACVVAKVLPIAAYREALVREGYVDEAVLAKELLLETKLNAAADVDALRKQKTDDAAAAQKVKDDAAAVKKAQAEADAAAKRRGSPSELKRAAVRGLIPIARVEEVLAPDYDADTVAIYIAELEAERADYVANQQKADDAAKRAANKGLNLGQLEAAVLDNVLTLQQFGQQLSRFELSDADQQILVATLTARKADTDAAKKKRDEAGTKAKAQSVNLSTFEQLVRKGIRPIADYDALLVSLGFGDADRASLDDLLQQQIAADAAAAQLRADTSTANAARGLSLDQARRAVVLGLQTLDWFQTFLVQQKYAVDAQAVLVDELRDDVAQADAARARREAATDPSGASALSLSTVARAAALGIIPPGQYEDALRARGYSDDDVAVELDLLTNEIADIQAARAKRAAADAGSTDAQLSLAQTAAAVKSGEASLADYQARAAALGLDDDDVTTLVRVLADELANTQAAKARRAALESTVKPGDVQLSALEQQVRDGVLSLADFIAKLTDAGLDPVDVDLLTGLLEDEVN